MPVTFDSFGVKFLYPDNWKSSTSKEQATLLLRHISLVKLVLINMFPLRDLRHNQCLMSPTTTIMMLFLCLFWTIAFVWQFPLLVLGILVGPLLRRQQFLIDTT